jgi:hypothetical protein
MTPEQWETVAANLPLVAWALRRSRIPEWDWDDSYQDGVFGLAAAVVKHDPEKGALSTFAVFSIRSAAQRGRKTRLGSGYRLALSRGADFEAPLSMDAELATEPGFDRYAVTPSADQPDDEGVSRALASEVASHCRDDIDRMAVAWAAGLLSISDAADGVRVTPHTLRNRLRRIQHEVAS